MRTRPFAYALAALALIGAGCRPVITSQVPPAPEPAPVQEGYAVSPAASQPPAEPVTVPQAEENSGTSTRAFGFIKAITHEEGKTYVTFDNAELFTNESAARAAHEDGKCTDEQFASGSCFSDNVYIRDKDASTQKLEVSAMAQVVTLHYDPSGRYEEAGRLVGIRDEKTVSFREFEKIYVGLGNGGYNVATPYHLTIKEGKVVKIEQQYVA